MRLQPQQATLQSCQAKEEQTAQVMILVGRVWAADFVSFDGVLVLQM